ncbi:hypothetical protein AW168_36900 [Nocardia brasiliensis]|nr:hypothetical protein AW168_36900 [Nocardia brasiliensis]
MLNTFPGYPATPPAAQSDSRLGNPWIRPRDLERTAGSRRDDDCPHDARNDYVSIDTADRGGGPQSGEIYLTEPWLNWGDF